MKLKMYVVFKRVYYFKMVKIKYSKHYNIFQKYWFYKDFKIM